MKKATFLIAVFIFLAGNIFAQDLRKRAEENPLDCALYLLTKDNQKRYTEEVANAFFDVGRYDDAFRAIDLDDNEYTKISWLTFRTKILIELGKTAKANEYSDKVLQLLSLEDVTWDKDVPLYLAPILIKLGRNEEALSLFNLPDDDNRARTIIGVSKAFLEANQTENALKYLPEAFEIAGTAQKAEIIELYARLNQREKAEKLLVEFEPMAFIEEKIYHNRRFILFPLINANLALGKTEHAIELWQQHGEQDDEYGWIKFIDCLLEFGHRERADIYLSQLETDSEMLRKAGGDIVGRRLKLGNIETALNLAKTMSPGNYQSQQQHALMQVSDYFIANGREDLALETLNFAFQKARKIVFDHQPLQSWSDGTWKVSYLTDIYRRLMKLRQFDKAFATINAVGSDHWIAKRFVMETLADFVRQQIKILPRKRIDAILMQIQTIFTEEDDEFYLIEAKLLTAEIYVQLGEKTKAVELLAKVLKEGKESCCYEIRFLLSAGKVFEQNKLKADTMMKKVLKEFIADAE